VDERPLPSPGTRGDLYGRGAVDMKVGIATMVIAAEVLASLGLRLAGDLLVSER
jgi:acetylornithine deacetylase/succinyl-diaminopimelate desuccinylase-like protein